MQDKRIHQAIHCKRNKNNSTIIDLKKTMNFILCVVAVCFVAIQAVPLKPQISTPCWDRYDQVGAEFEKSGKILSEPYYFPECTSDGTEWKLAQCVYELEPSCFCVDPKTGEPREDTIIYSLNVDQLNCKAGKVQTGQCHIERKELIAQIAELPQRADINLPVCQEDGQYEAMQSTAFFFYCVDTVTGEEIPDTAFNPYPRMGNPITQSICQDYSDLWSNFNQWFAENLLDETQETNENYKTEQWRDYRATHANAMLRTHFEMPMEELVEPQEEESYEWNEMPSEEA